MPIHLTSSLHKYLYLCQSQALGFFLLCHVILFFCFENITSAQPAQAGLWPLKQGPAQLIPINMRKKTKYQSDDNLQ